MGVFLFDSRVDDRPGDAAPKRGKAAQRSVGFDRSHRMGDAWLDREIGPDAMDRATRFGPHLALLRESVAPAPINFLRDLFAAGGVLFEKFVDVFLAHPGKDVLPAAISFLLQPGLGPIVGRRKDFLQCGNEPFAGLGPPVGMVQIHINDDLEMSGVQAVDGAELLLAVAIHEGQADAPLEVGYHKGAIFSSLWRTLQEAVVLCGQLPLTENSREQLLDLPQRPGRAFRVITGKENDRVKVFHGGLRMAAHPLLGLLYVRDRAEQWNRYDRAIKNLGIENLGYCLSGWSLWRHSPNSVSTSS